MNELIQVNFDEKSDKPTISGRELHKALEIETPYHKWFPRMCEYGFTENIDYTVTDIFVHNQKGGKQGYTDHQLTISMAKELCMIQRSEIGRRIRQYFIQIEEQWNKPEAVMARALKIANSQLTLAQQSIKALETAVEHEQEKNRELIQVNTACMDTMAQQTKQIKEMKPKSDYCDMVLNTPDAVDVTVIAKDYAKSAAKFNSFLHTIGIQYNSGGTWVLYAKHTGKGYTVTKTFPYTDGHGVKRSKTYMRWTQKGRMFLYEELKKYGIVPVMECLYDV